jgi:hypothetical protein
MARHSLVLLVSRIATASGTSRQPVPTEAPIFGPKEFARTCGPPHIRSERFAAYLGLTHQLAVRTPCATGRPRPKSVWFRVSDTAVVSPNDFASGNDGATVAERRPDRRPAQLAIDNPPEYWRTAQRVGIILYDIVADCHSDLVFDEF